MVKSIALRRLELYSYLIGFLHIRRRHAAVLNFV